MKVRDIMTRDVSYVTVNSDITSAANIMKSINVGIVPVCDENKNPVGVITDRDIVLRSVTEPNNSARSKSDTAAGNIISTSPEADAHEAAALMSKNQIRSLLFGVN